MGGIFNDILFASSGIKGCDSRRVSMLLSAFGGDGVSIGDTRFLGRGGQVVGFMCARSNVRRAFGFGVSGNAVMWGKVHETGTLQVLDGRLGCLCFWAIMFFSIGHFPGGLFVCGGRVSIDAIFFQG